MCADPVGPGLKGCWSAFPPLPPRWGSGQRLGRPGERPAGSRVRRHPLLSPLPPPPALSGRLAPSRAALLCLCISPPRGGGGGPLSRRGAVRGREGVSSRSPPGRGSPGRGRRRAGVARGAARRRPPFWPQVGGARRLCSESGLRPVGPSPHAHFLLPVSLLRTRVASGTPTGPPVGAVGGWLLGSELNGSMGKPILPKGA